MLKQMSQTTTNLHSFISCRPSFPLLSYLHPPSVYLLAPFFRIFFFSWHGCHVTNCLLLLHIGVYSSMYPWSSIFAFTSLSRRECHITSCCMHLHPGIYNDPCPRSLIFTFASLSWRECHVINCCTHLHTGVYNVPHTQSLVFAFALTITVLIAASQFSHVLACTMLTPTLVHSPFATSSLPPDHKYLLLQGHMVEGLGDLIWAVC